MFPETSKVDVGEIIPMPTLPFVFICTESIAATLFDKSITAVKHVSTLALSNKLLAAISITFSIAEAIIIYYFILFYFILLK